MRTVGLLLACALTACASSSAAPDAATAAWWATTEALSNDGMEGRDTGSPGYDRAAAYVADRFRAAGLQPAGENGTYFQTLDLREVAIVNEETSLTVATTSGATRPLRFLHEIVVAPSAALPATLDAPLIFNGYCALGDVGDVRGKIVVCFGARRAGLPTAVERLQAVSAAGALAIVNVDDMSFVEPPRWPVAYARSITFATAPPAPASIPSLRLNADTFVDLATRTGQDGRAIRALGEQGAPLPSFDFNARLQARFSVRQRNLSSANVLAVLPGTDPALRDQPVLLTAHLDGYGYGATVNGDGLYNGALDDAAYVATLIQLADERGGRGFRRPVIFAAFTGEEKGLLGSRYLAAHPTPNAPLPIAVLNLDQLRPLYPLRILTTLALEDSTLGQTVRDVAEPTGIEVRPDLEPERGLLRRTDHWPFMERGVPAVSFLFGFDQSDTEAAARYRDWYENRYHAPQDDMTTPIDFQAQADFHRFYFTLVERVANAEAPPQWLPDSPNRPRAAN